MRKDISLPEIYKSSADFRFFCKWIELGLAKIGYDTENFMDLYDPLKCPSDLLWALADTMGFKYDDRLMPAFNRLVLLYFMSMIRNRGSKDGMVLAAEVNLAQFPLQQAAEGYTDYNDVEHPGSEILFDRLENTSIPVNTVSVTPHVEEGYIDVVYSSSKVPVDACLEYVRPLGMYVFESAGVTCEAHTSISVDTKLTDSNDIGISIGPTHVGHYRRADYASLQSVKDESAVEKDPSLHPRNPAFYRNSKYEVTPTIDAGYRTLYSLQLCNGEEVVRALVGEEIFKLYKDGLDATPEWNLRLDRTAEEEEYEGNVESVENRPPTESGYGPVVAPVMFNVGDAILPESSQ